MKYLLIGIIGLIGVIGSIWEYRNWKTEETTNYGQGRAQTKSLKESKTLIGPYVNEKLGFRIRYPQNWNVKEEKQMTTFYLNAIYIQVSVVTTPLDFPDFLDTQAKNVIRDRDYTDSLVILTFDGNQKAYTQKGNKVFVITAQAAKENWNEYELTFREVYKSLVIF